MLCGDTRAESEHPKMRVGGSALVCAAAWERGCEPGTRCWRTLSVVDPVLVWASDSNIREPSASIKEGCVDWTTRKLPESFK